MLCIAVVRPAAGVGDFAPVHIVQLVLAVLRQKSYQRNYQNQRDLVVPETSVLVALAVVAWLSCLWILMVEPLTSQTPSGLWDGDLMSTTFDGEMGVLLGVAALLECLLPLNGAFWKISSSAAGLTYVVPMTISCGEMVFVA